MAKIAVINQKYPKKGHFLFSFFVLVGKLPQLKPILAAILYPAQIPTIPPPPARSTEETENTLPPHMSGIYAPAYEPIIIKIIIIDFTAVFFLKNTCSLIPK